MNRAVGIVRLSVEKDETTSPPRQRQIIQASANIRGSTIVGWAEDLDVSATRIAPLKRPELGKWLARPGDLDEFIFWRMDRFVRGPADLTDMIRWANEHGKGLASATEAFDLRTPLGEAMAYLAAIFGKMESKAISERVTGAHEYLRQVGRWGGGTPPYGYAPAPNPDGKGWVLVLDEEAAEVIREAVRRVIAGQSVNSIVGDLNTRKIPTPRDHARARADREVTGQPWKTFALAGLLRNPLLLGYVTYQGKPVPGEDGTPIVQAPPIISETDWDRLQHALQAPERKQRQRTDTPSLLLRVAFCAACGSPYHRGPRGCYRCKQHSEKAQHTTACPALQIRTGALDLLAELLFLAQVGQVEMMERVYRPGVDHSNEIALIRRAREAARKEYDGGGYSYPGGEEEYQRRVAYLSGRRRGLASVPTVEAGYVLRPAGQTFAQRWAKSTTAERRALMTGAGFQLRVSRVRHERITGKTKRAEMREDLEQKLGQLLLALGVRQIPREDWDELRRLVDPDTNLTVAFDLEPDLAHRAGLAAQGQPTTVPDTAELWRQVLAPGSAPQPARLVRRVRDDA